jgi:hypothetical protein
MVFSVYPIKFNAIVTTLYLFIKLSINRKIVPF